MLIAKKIVGDRRFTNTRGTKQSCCLSFSKIFTKCFQSNASHTTHDVNRGRACNFAHLINIAGNILTKVGFAKDNNRVGTAARSDNQVSLNPVQIEIVVEACDDEYCVDVCSEDLFVVYLSGLFPGEFTYARERVLYDEKPCLAIFFGVLD